MYNVMVVDDETTIRKGIVLLIDWTALNCNIVYEAKNGIDACNYLENNSVDFIITDIKMPGMDGMQLTKYVHEHYASIYVIILTAYDDFIYAQQSIKYRVVDFILKTNYIKQIPIAIVEAITLLEAENKRKEKITTLERNLNEQLPQSVEHFLKDILNEAISANSSPSKINYHLKPSLNNFYVGVIEFSPKDASANIDTITDATQFKTDLRNFLSQSFKQYEFYVLWMSHNTLVLVVNLDSKIISTKDSIVYQTEKFLRLIQDYKEILCNIGISQQHFCLDEIKIAYGEALDCICFNYYNNQVMSFYSMSYNNWSQNIFFQNNYPGKEFIVTLMSKGIIEVTEYLDEIFRIFKLEQISIFACKSYCIWLCELWYSLIPTHSTYLSEFTNDYYQSLKKCVLNQSSADNLLTYIKVIANKINDSMKPTDINHHYAVKEVCDYIKNHYREEIKLDEISTNLNLNSSYLSTLFKRETGYSIFEFLSIHRMEVAKKLLNSTDIRIYEVGISIGIDDPAYFTNVFKKYVGVSPKAYQKSKKVTK